MPTKRRHQGQQQQQQQRQRQRAKTPIKQYIIILDNFFYLWNLSILLDQLDKHERFGQLHTTNKIQNLSKCSKFVTSFLLFIWNPKCNIVFGFAGLNLSYVVSSFQETTAIKMMQENPIEFVK